MTKKQRKRLIRIIISAVGAVILNFLPITGVIRFLMFFGIYLVIGYDILKKAAAGIVNGRLFDENFLMAIATVGAFLLAIYSKSGDYNEAVAVMLFYQTGELFQSCAVGRSRKNISELMNIRPDYANIEKDGRLTVVSPEEVRAGSIIIIQPGEKIPIDGIVEEGTSSLDTTALTGESMPRSVKEGDSVISGCVNGTGLLKVRTVKEFGESAVSKILELVENAVSHKSKTEKFISKFARGYTPAVCCCASALAVIPPVILMLAGESAQWSDWIYRALTFLVISCPCALVISIPLTFFAGIGGASREGILIKGADFLEGLSQIKYAVFDKTGTLTEGVFEVREVLNNSIDKSKLIEYAALAECASSHPIGKSLQKAYGQEPDRSRVTEIEEISGKGVTAKVDGISVAVGNYMLMEKMNIDCCDCGKEGTAVHISVAGKYSGTVIISDRIKPDAGETVAELKRIGIKKTVMLTGDSSETAKRIAAELKVDEVCGELLPAEKVTAVEKLLAEKNVKEKLAFVGDGINDAPVLARADIGIAMGAMGSDAAIEAADVVLMEDRPSQIVKAIGISRKCMKIVRQNIIFSLTVKFLCLGLVAAGAADMWVGIFADVGVMVIAVMNAIRALKIKF